MKPLSERAQALYDEVSEEFELETPERVLLESACRVLDRIDELESCLEAGSLVTQTARGGQPRVHPAVIEVRQQHLVLGRLLATLRLPVDDEEGRPQARGGFRGHYGAS